MNATIRKRGNANPGCEAFDLNLAAYLEGEDRPEVVRHARECAYCKVVLADFEQIRHASSDLPIPEPPARLWTHIRASLEAEGIIRPQPAFGQRLSPAPGCEAFHNNLSAYLDGEERPEVSRHARECAYCKVVLADFEQIHLASSELPLPEPPARLWANIRSTLEAEGVIRPQLTFWQRWFPVPHLAPEARPVGALLAIATLAIVLIGSTQTFQPSISPAIMPPGTNVDTAGIAPELTPALKETVHQMEEAFRAEESTYEPAMMATYKKSLDALDVTIAETKGQCERDPADQLAKHYLVNAYEMKAEVLASALESSR